MKNNILVFLMMFLCLQISAQQRRKNIPQRRTMTSVKKGTSQTIKKVREVGEDGFIWYKLQKGNLYGAADIDGNTIIPIKYNSIHYCCDDFYGTHCFYVKAGDYAGVYTRLGKCIIPLEKHFTSVYVTSQKSQAGRVYLYVLVADNNKNYGLYDIKGNEVVPLELEYDHCWLADVGSILYIAISKDGLTGALDLNGNLVVPPCTESLIYMHKDIISISHKDKKSEVIYRTNSEDTRFDYNNYDGIYRPFKAIKSSSSNSSSLSSRTNTSKTTGRVDSKKVKNEKIPFPLVASRKYKIKSTFMGEESHVFSGEGYVEYKGNKIIINLGFTTKEYTLNQPPKPQLGVLGMIFEAMDVVCDGEKGKLSIVESQSTISIEPIGFSMNLGYVVKK